MSSLFSRDQATLRTLLSVCPSVTPFWQCSCHCIILKFSGVITIDRRDVHAKGQGQRSKVKVTEVKTQLQPFPDCNSSLNSHMVMKWCTKLDVIEERCPIVFQGHLSNFKVTQLKKLLILTQIRLFRTVTPVWIQWWLWNDAQTWSTIEEVPYCFSMSPIKFQGHREQKISDFDPNWVCPDCTQDSGIFYSTWNT